VQIAGHAEACLGIEDFLRSACPCCRIDFDAGAPSIHTNHTYIYIYEADGPSSSSGVFVPAKYLIPEPGAEPTPWAMDPLDVGDPTEDVPLYVFHAKGNRGLLRGVYKV